MTASSAENLLGGNATTTLLLANKVFTAAIGGTRSASPEMTIATSKAFEYASHKSCVYEGRLQVSSVAKKNSQNDRFFLTLNFAKSIPSLAAILRVAASMSYR